MGDATVRASIEAGEQSIPAMLTAASDGALWVTVDGADVEELAAKISAVCEALVPEQSRGQ